MRPNSLKLIQACDWLTALLPSVVKNVNCKLCPIKICHYKMPSFLPTQSTSQGVVPGYWVIGIQQFYSVQWSQLQGQNVLESILTIHDYTTMVCQAPVTQ
jgi:hypothetical protein